jgi:hypothetical protein
MAESADNGTAGAIKVTFSRRVSDPAAFSRAHMSRMQAGVAFEDVGGSEVDLAGVHGHDSLAIKMMEIDPLYKHRLF